MCAAYYPKGATVAATTLPEEWKNYTLILPCVGVGNVPQLAVDLFITNTSPVSDGHLDTTSLPAVVGLDPYGEDPSELATTTQLYVSVEHKLAFLQTRAPPVPGYRKKLIEELTSFLKAARFQRIIILSSSFGMQRHDAELLGPPIRYLSNGAFVKSNKSLLRQLGWQPISLEGSAIDSITGQPFSKESRLDGCGIAYRLFTKICDSFRAPICLLNLFTSEGDNSEDALRMATHLNTFLKVIPEGTKWNLPVSWCVMYGSNTERLLY